MILLAASLLYGCAGGNSESTASYYDGIGAYGACGTILEAGDYGAVSHECYQASQCGTYAKITGPKGSVVIKILDKCPSCKAGEVDISSTAFAKIADLDSGRVKVTWSLSDSSGFVDNNVPKVSFGVSQPPLQNSDSSSSSVNNTNSIVNTSSSGFQSESESNMTSPSNNKLNGILNTLLLLSSINLVL